MKYLILSTLIFTLSLTAMNNKYQKTGDRNPCAAGAFYPAAPEALKREIYGLFSAIGTRETFSGVRAIIIPHAGYVYSGKVAASGFAAIPPDQGYSNIFLIGSSHRVAFNGASVYNTGNYITPLGTIKVNLQIANELIENSRHFTFKPDAHLQEHCLEVQLPFIQSYFRNPPPIVPIIIGSNDTGTIKAIADALKPWFTPDNLFIISSDFTHYPPYSDAVRIDRETASAIVTGSSEKFLSVLAREEPGIQNLATKMCGWSAGLTLLYLTEDIQGARYEHLMYMNSGDSPYGDREGVVGYNSFAVVEQKDPFTIEEEDELFNIARKSIESTLFGHQTASLNLSGLPESLRTPSGAFVTLYRDGNLRGCIGRITSSDPLCDCVAEMAHAAAFEDTRFPPLTQKEYSDVTIEISVLSPLHKINNINEIEIGKHGLLLKKDGRTGVLLPQVATERGWSVTEFLEKTASEKAGIGKDGWKDAEIFIFEAFVLHEKK